MKSPKDTLKMNNGARIPCLGFGTFLTSDEVAEKAVGVALEAGYRHIDTASYYKNEKGVGQAVRRSGIPRGEIFVTTKLWNDDQGYGTTLEAFHRSLDRLGLDYLDLYLIHWPMTRGRERDWVRLNRESWDAMTMLYEDGLVKSVGVSNFRPHHIESLMEMSDLWPQVNQIELHPGLLQQQTVDYCRAHDIVVEAWGPFSRGNIFTSGLLAEVAEKYGRTPAQVCLRWHLQRGHLPLPKSVTPERIIENTRIFDFELAPEDMAAINAISQDTGTGFDPDKVAW